MSKEMGKNLKKYILMIHKSVKKGGITSISLDFSFFVLYNSLIKMIFR